MKSELSLNFFSLTEVGFMCFLHIIERTHIPHMTAELNFGVPRRPPLVQVRPSEAGLAECSMSITHILRLCSFSKIENGVIQSTIIPVIYLIWHVSIDIKPS